MTDGLWDNAHIQILKYIDGLIYDIKGKGGILVDAFDDGKNQFPEIRRPLLLVSIPGIKIALQEVVYIIAFIGITVLHFFKKFLKA